MDAKQSLSQQFNVTISKSYKLLLYLIFIHIMMLSVMLSLTLHLIPALIIIGLFIFSFVYYFGRYFLFTHKHSVVSMTYLEGNNWQIRFANSNKSDIARLKASYASPYFTVLYFKRENQFIQQCILLMHDAVDAKTYRKLLVYCRDVKTFQK